jgi:uncharacterized membrane protein
MTPLGWILIGVLALGLVGGLIYWTQHGGGSQGGNDD